MQPYGNPFKADCRPPPQQCRQHRLAPVALPQLCQFRRPRLRPRCGAHCRTSRSASFSPRSCRTHSPRLRLRALTPFALSTRSSKRSRKVSSPRYQPRRKASCAAWSIFPPSFAARASSQSTYALRSRPLSASAKDFSNRSISSHGGPLPFA